MDSTQLLVMLGGAGTVIGTLATTVYKLMTARITALEAENATLRQEAREAVKAKDAEIATLRRIALERAERQAP